STATFRRPHASLSPACGMAFARLTLRENGGVELRRPGRGREVAFARQDDLVEREAVLAVLNAEPMRPGGREVNGGAEHIRPPAIVFPAPAGQAAAFAGFQVVLGGPGRADQINRRAL